MDNVHPVVREPAEQTVQQLKIIFKNSPRIQQVINTLLRNGLYCSENTASGGRKIVYLRSLKSQRWGRSVVSELCSVFSNTERRERLRNVGIHYWTKDKVVVTPGAILFLKAKENIVVGSEYDIESRINVDASERLKRFLQSTTQHNFLNDKTVKYLKAIPDVEPLMYFIERSFNRWDFKKVGHLNHNAKIKASLNELFPIKSGDVSHPEIKSLIKNAFSECYAVECLNIAGIYYRKHEGKLIIPGWVIDLKMK